jgi:O-acetyl-ADP-ribose deacetylase (regulator of RNase III)
MENIIKHYIGNLFDYITTEKIDTILNAANGRGPMGHGIAGAIRRQGGSLVQKDAMDVCRRFKPTEGTAYKTISGDLEKFGVKRIIHAVTMLKPGGKTSYDIVEKAFDSALKMAVEESSTKIACTALGTGVGKLDPEKVALIMYNIALKYIDKIDIVFIDIDPVFINKLEGLIQEKSE